VNGLGSAELLFGTSGWSYNEWVGPFYDEKKGMFTQYTKFFRTAEVNSTFYAYPTPSMVRGWYRSSPPTSSSPLSFHSSSPIRSDWTPRRGWRKT
jgi:hypothetical protein